MSSRLSSHGLQTCLTEPCIVRLILAPPMSGYGSRNDMADLKNGKTSGWTNSNTSLLCKEPKEQEYIHPSAKKSMDQLSQKSLEMCTESLGTETGSNIIMELESINTPPVRTRKIKVNQSNSFPPPLTSLTGASGFVRVKPHREAGRLVLKAVSMPSSNPFFHAERANGRLKLRVVQVDHTVDESKFEAQEEISSEMAARNQES